MEGEIELCWPKIERIEEILRSFLGLAERKMEKPIHLESEMMSVSEQKPTQSEQVQMVIFEVHEREKLVHMEKELIAGT